MKKQTISSKQSAAVIGAYSPAIRVADTVYISGQIPLHPQTMELVKGDIEVQIRQAFSNLEVLCKAASANLDDIVKLRIYLLDLDDFSLLNKIMEEIFSKPYPARAVVQVLGLPKGAQVELDAELVVA